MPQPPASVDVGTPPVKPSIDKRLDAAELESLCSVAAPCFTIFLPAYRPAAQSAPEAVLLKHLLRVAQDSPGTQKLDGKGKDLLEPLHEMAERNEFSYGGAARALFSAPGFAAAYRCMGDLPEKLALGRHPYIRPLLAQALAPPETFALAVARKHLRLFYCGPDTTDERPLPAGVPSSIAEAEESSPPDHDLQNRSATGASTGTGFVATFGTLADREAAPERLHHYFEIVDRGLHAFLKSAPVFLMGVREDLAAFRKVSRHLKLLSAQSEGSVDGHKPEEIGRIARAAAAAVYRERAEAVFQQFREMPNRAHTLRGNNRVLEAAEQGRVHQLLLPEQGEAPAAQASSRRNLLLSEDVLNATAVETIRRGGQVFTLPATLMDGPEARAILRY